MATAAAVPVYARALCRALQPLGAAEAEAVQAALRALADAVARPEVASALAAPGRSRSERAQWLIQSLGDSLPPLLANLLQLLAEHGRLAVLPDLPSALEAEMRAQQGRRQVAVSCASKPQQEQQEQLRKQLEARLLPDGKGELELEFDTDPALLGGFVARCGDRLIDASLAGRLARLRQTVGSA